MGHFLAKFLADLPLHTACVREVAVVRWEKNLCDPTAKGRENAGPRPEFTHAHCLILEGQAAFDEQYLVAGGPVNPKTGEPYGKATKAYAEWIAAQTREIERAWFS